MGPAPLHQSSANGIRTRVWALRGPRPSPLDDSAKRPAISTSAQQARQESNLQPPVLETGALPIELRTSAPLPGWLTGLEPATSGATVRRSNRLSYNHHVQPGPRFQSRKKYRIWGGRVKARTAPRAPRSR